MLEALIQVDKLDSLLLQITSIELSSYPTGSLYLSLVVESWYTYSLVSSRRGEDNLIQLLIQCIKACVILGSVHAYHFVTIVVTIGIVTSLWITKTSISDDDPVTIRQPKAILQKIL